MRGAAVPPVVQPGRGLRVPDQSGQHPANVSPLGTGCVPERSARRWSTRTLVRLSWGTPNAVQGRTTATLFYLTSTWGEKHANPPICEGHHPLSRTRAEARPTMCAYPQARPLRAPMLHACRWLRWRGRHPPQFALNASVYLTIWRCFAGSLTISHDTGGATIDEPTLLRLPASETPIARLPRLLLLWYGLGRSKRLRAVRWTAR